MDEELDPDALLADIGFDPDRCVLTRRQALVLALREREITQREIADRLGTSRANVSNIESSARKNVQKARETVDIADALTAPVCIPIEPGTDLFDIPRTVYAVCDEQGMKVTQASAALLRRIREEAPQAIQDHTIVNPLQIRVKADGTITVQARST